MTSESDIPTTTITAAAAAKVEDGVGVFSLLDTDLYKLTMQCAVLRYFPDTEVEYQFTNRTPRMRLNGLAFGWLERQVGSM